MYKITIIGSFGHGEQLLDGQTVKTKELAKLFASKFGADAICEVDTHVFFSHPFTFFRNVIKSARMSENIIILPAHNAVRLVPFLVYYFRRKNASIFYSVVGGWLPEFLNRKPILKALLKKLDGLWVETKTMKSKLDDLGFKNVDVIPNFKFLKILSKDELSFELTPSLKLCIFSRVNKNKGISFAANVIRDINREAGYNVFTLDVYGKVTDGYDKEFAQLCSENSTFLRYCGSVEPSESTKTIRQYFALLFPTLYPTEGIPGTIIDAYSSGVPVISARWKSFEDVVDEGKTGIGFVQGDATDLKRVLKEIAENPSVIMELKETCIEKSHDYTPETALKMLLSRMYGEQTGGG